MNERLHATLAGRYGRAYNDGARTLPDGGFGAPGHWEQSARWEQSADGILRAYEYLYGRRPATLLDVGCGRGVMVDAIRRRGVLAWGVDIGADIRTPWAVVADALRLPWAAPFDLVVALDLVEHLPDDEQAELAQELRRMSRGPAFVTVPTEEPHYRLRSNVGPRNHYLALSAEEWRAHFTALGWRVVADGPALAVFGAPFHFGPANYPFALEREASCS